MSTVKLKTIFYVYYIYIYIFLLAPPIKLQTTLSRRAPYIEHLKGRLVLRFWMTILDAGLMPLQPASDPIGFFGCPSIQRRKRSPLNSLLKKRKTNVYNFSMSISKEQILALKPVQPIPKTNFQWPVFTLGVL